MYNLQEKQQDLDKQKYFYSLNLRTDMSGKMEYCKGCLFRNDKHQCEISYEAKKEFNICARHYFKEEEKKNELSRIEQENKKRKSRPIRTKNNG